MHDAAAAGQLTDSMRCTSPASKAADPAAGRVGVQPEWFYKGTGADPAGPRRAARATRVRRRRRRGAGGRRRYVIDDAGRPCALASPPATSSPTTSWKRKNYLYLADSKLRECRDRAGARRRRAVSQPDRRGDHPPRRRRPWTARDPSPARNTWPTRWPTSSTTTSSTRPTACRARRTSTSSAPPRSASAPRVQFTDGDVMEVAWEGLGRPLRNACGLRRGRWEWRFPGFFRAKPRAAGCGAPRRG